MMGEHALLSASSADRWMHCPPSARLTEHMPDITSDYAEEGRLAHAIAELKVRKQYLEPMGPRTFTTRLNKLKKDPHYQPEMLTHTDTYLDYIKELTLGYLVKPYLAVEQKLDLSELVPEAFGTADCVIVGGDTLDIVDFKYGKGVPVDAEGNAQMRLYAWGALMRYRALYDIQTIRMSIVQPRLNSITTAEMARDDLLNWAAFEVRPKAKTAYDGAGEYAAGEWCRFCKAKAVCRARASQYLELEPEAAKCVDELSPAEIGDILFRAEGLQAWVDALKDHALREGLAGNNIPGWKVVEGRGVRAFDNLDAAFADLLAAGVEEPLLYERRPLTLAAIEKTLGKARFAELCGGHVVKSPGKPTLAPAADKRPAFNSAAVDFAGLETE